MQMVAHSSEAAETVENLKGPLDEPGFTFTVTGLAIDPKVTFEQWERYGRKLQIIERGIQWAIGDWIIFGENKWGEVYAQAIDVTGLKVKTLQNYASVAKAIPRSRRRDSDVVDFSTHAEVASLEPEEQEKILSHAETHHTTVRGVRREVEKIRRDKRPKPPDTDIILSRSSREFLDDYMADLASWPEKYPPGIPQTEREALEKMIYGHGSDALWLKNRTREADYKAITEMFSFDEGTPGMERAQRADISAWLEKCGYYMSDSDLDERLDVMVEKKMLQVKSVEDSRQEGRRGSMLDLYALHPDYEAELENH